MTKEKKKAPAAAHGVAAAARRSKMERAMQYSEPVWRNLNALKAPPKMKHRSYFEAVENTDKKKKLEFEITTKREPPPGFEFIPTGHPELSQECKEQSREAEAMFFIVSNSKDTLKLDHHMNRLGYHFRHAIVEEARKVLKTKGHHDQAAYVHEPGKPEPIPNSQREIDQEADAVLRDLFPRIPNTDRQEIIDHAFKKDGMFNGEVKVGMAKDITLARRVQLAALAHIRHTHTRYDALLKESDWANARKAVEKPCLDIIVKWRGDEETGRDQLDEILREVIEISDTESGSEEEETDPIPANIHARTSGSAVVSVPNKAVSRLSRVPDNQPSRNSRTSSPLPAAPRTPTELHKLSKAQRKKARKTQQRFKRYAAAAEALASSNTNDRQETTPGFVATPREVVRRQGSAHLVDPHRLAPNTAAQEAYTPKLTYDHIEGRPVPASQPSSSNQHRIPGIPHVSTDSSTYGGTEQFIRVPDAQRPKVGPYSAGYSQTAYSHPLSPVRLGLQDMLLPSIEPRSPMGAQVLRDATQRIHSEAHRSAEAPRVIPRAVMNPAPARSRPQSPSAMINNEEGAIKRRRVTTYFPEDFQRYSDSTYIRVAPQSREDMPRHRQLEYLEDQHPVASRVPEHVIYQEISWPASGQEVRGTQPVDNPDWPRGHPIPVPGDDRFSTGARVQDGCVAYYSDPRGYTHQERQVNRVEAPVRSRARPIIVDEGDNYEPRRVVEVRRSPHGIYRTGSPRGAGIHAPYMQGAHHIQDPSPAVYVDGSVGHPGSGLSDRDRLIARFQPGQPAYQERNRSLSPHRALPPERRFQSRIVEQPVRYVVPGNREVYQVHGSERVPLAQSSAMSRTVHAPPYETPRQPGNNVIYRDNRFDFDRRGEASYGPSSQQPFPVHPAPSSYSEIRGPPTQRSLHDHRDVIYVE